MSGFAESPQSTIPQSTDAYAYERHWRPATRLVRGGTRRSEHGETSEAVYLNSGFVYDSAETAEARFAGEAPGFNHLSFEVYDFDDVQTGHDFLKTQDKYKHVWGIGRHYLGSQIFDYWRDPWGRIHEHWTDSDMINNSHKASVVPAEKGLSNQWGPEFPPAFLDDPEQHAQ